MFILFKDVGLEENFERVFMEREGGWIIDASIRRRF